MKMNATATIGIIISCIALSFVFYCHLLGCKLFVLTSGSMEPALSPGTLIVTQPQRRYYPGEVVTFRQLKTEQLAFKQDQITITHRVVASNKEKSSLTYITKGDANRYSDRVAVNHDQVYGKAILAFPIIGFLLLWPHSQLGFYFVVLLPALYIMTQQLLKIITTIIHANQN